MERTRAIKTNMLALKIGQLKDIVDSLPRIDDHISPDLLDDSATARRKNRE